MHGHMDKLVVTISEKGSKCCKSTKNPAPLVVNCLSEIVKNLEAFEARNKIDYKNLPATLVQEIWNRLLQAQLKHFPVVNLNLGTNHVNCAEMLLQTGVLKCVSLIPWKKDPDLFAEQLRRIPETVPKVHRLTCLCNRKSMTRLPDDLNLRDWERMQHLMVLRLPCVSFSLEFISLLPKLRILECCLDNEDFSQNISHLEKLKKLEQLYVMVSKLVSINDKFAAVELARLVGQMPALRKIGMSTNSKKRHQTALLQRQFVSAVGPFLVGRLVPLCLQQVSLKAPSRNFVWPDGLEAEFLNLSGLMDEATMKCVQQLPLKSVTKLELKNIQPGFFYRIVDLMGPGVEKLSFTLNNTGARTWQADILQLDKVLSSTSNITLFTLLAPRIKLIR